jgi:hypothetical protein
MFNFFKKKKPALIPRYWVFAARPDPMSITGGFRNQEERREWVHIVDTHTYQVWRDEW